MGILPMSYGGTVMIIFKFILTYAHWRDASATSETRDAFLRLDRDRAEARQAHESGSGAFDP